MPVIPIFPVKTYHTAKISTPCQIYTIVKNELNGDTTKAWKMSLLSNIISQPKTWLPRLK